MRVLEIYGVLAFVLVTFVCVDGLAEWLCGWLDSREDD